MGWGQFIRWADPTVERRHYHLHTGAWPTAHEPWLQWTASPPAVADLDGDGRNEVIGLPNVERHIPYRTQGYAFMVLDGAYGDGTARRGGTRASRRCRCATNPAYRPDGDWYPPSGIPAPTVVEPHRRRAGPRSSPPCPAARSTRSARAAIGCGPTSTRTARAKTFASEVVAADLNKDGTPELVFGTYALHATPAA